MNNYIKREDAIKQIVKGEEMYGEEFATDTGRVKDFLNVLPSADVVEVVRCKDCKHHEEFLFDDSKLLCWAHDIDIVVSPTDYCSYGERKQEE